MEKQRNADVIVIGAGPYGLSAAAHLRAAGVDARTFGEPMSFWERNMPRGMLLRSPYPACIVDVPGRLTLDDFARATGRPVPRPVPLGRFLEFGRWIQQQVAPDVDRRWITSVRREGDDFSVTMEDGEALRARSVVVAAGIAPFAWRPPEFSSVTPDVVSHTVDEADLRRFAGKVVVVVGGGQSAIESAALLHEAGASAELLARGSIRFVGRRRWLHTGPASVLNHPYEIGPAGLSHLVAVPAAFTRIPRPMQDRWAARAIRPAGAAWLEPRLVDVSQTEGRSIVAADMTIDGRARLRLTDGTTRVVDHVLLATGYRIDINQYAFLDPAMLRAVDCMHGYPQLSAGLESSVPGLYFVGAPSAWSCGPLVRFVAGTRFTSPRLVRGIIRSLERRTATVGASTSAGIAA